MPLIRDLINIPERVHAALQAMVAKIPISSGMSFVVTRQMSAGGVKVRFG